MVTAINMLPHGGGQVNRLGRAPEPLVAHLCSPTVHSRPPSTLRMSSTVHVGSLTMMDLWAKLERRHLSEDDRITIER
jgi:midasin (ATPase involved in ribosome maturation)